MHVQQYSINQQLRLVVKCTCLTSKTSKFCTSNRILLLIIIIIIIIITVTIITREL